MALRAKVAGKTKTSQNQNTMGGHDKTSSSDSGAFPFQKLL